MSGAGAEHSAIGAAGGAFDEDEGVWALERRRSDDWVEVQRFGSEAVAQEALDELAAAEGIPLEDLRLRRVGK
jgi:hypothetical protein